MRKTIIIFYIFLSVSCAHSIHLVNVNPFDLSSGKTEPKLIEARSEQHVILWFVYDTDYVNDSYKILKNQCLNGRIEGITTQFSTSLGFLSWHNKILMKGFCFKDT